MQFDVQNLFSDDQAITATAASTNVIDLLGVVGTPPTKSNALDADAGAGRAIPLLIQATETFTAAGAATLDIALQVDTVEGMGSPTTVWTSETLALATLVAGFKLPFSYLPKGMNERFGRLNFTVTTGPMTAGKITAGVLVAEQTNMT